MRPFAFDIRDTHYEKKAEEEGRKFAFIGIAGCNQHMSRFLSLATFTYRVFEANKY